MNMIQTQMYKGTEKLDSLRAEMNISKKQLDEWLAIQTEKDQDNQAIMAYAEEDEAKIKTLNMQLEKANSEYNKLKSSMDAEVCD